MTLFDTLVPGFKSRYYFPPVKEAKVWYNEVLFTKILETVNSSKLQEKRWMIFLLVFYIDVCSGLVVARFISITSLTHLKNLNKTHRKSFIQNCTILYRQSPSWASLPHISSVAIEQRVFLSQARCVEMLWSRSRRHEVMIKGWVGKVKNLMAGSSEKTSLPILPEEGTLRF